LPGSDPAIHETDPHARQYCCDVRRLIMDARVKPAHDSSMGPRLGPQARES